MKLSLLSTFLLLVTIGVVSTNAETNLRGTNNGNVILDDTAMDHEPDDPDHHHRNLRQFAENQIVRFESSFLQLESGQSGNTMWWDNRPGDNNHQFVLKQASNCFTCYYVIHRARNQYMMAESDRTARLRSGTPSSAVDVWRFDAVSDGRFRIRSQARNTCLSRRAGQVVLTGRDCSLVNINTAASPTSPLDDSSVEVTIDNIETGRRLVAPFAYSAGALNGPYATDEEQRWTLNPVDNDAGYEIISSYTNEILGCNEFDQIFTFPREIADVTVNQERLYWQLQITDCPTTDAVDVGALAICVRLVCPAFNRALADGVVDEYLGYTGNTVLQQTNSNLINQVWVITTN